MWDPLNTDHWSYLSVSCNSGTYNYYKMESELTRVIKPKSIENRGIWKFQRMILNSHGALDVTLGTDVRPANLGNTANKATCAAYARNFATYSKADTTAQKCNRDHRRGAADVSYHKLHDSCRNVAKINLNLWAEIRGEYTYSCSKIGTMPRRRARMTLPRTSPNWRI